MSLPPAEVANIVTGRCAMCHAPEPSWPGIQIAPKGVLLHEPERIAAQARAIGAQAVMTHAMPPNNLTGMTAAERQVLGGLARANPLKHGPLQSVQPASKPEHGNVISFSFGSYRQTALSASLTGLETGSQTGTVRAEGPGGPA